MIVIVHNIMVLNTDNQYDCSSITFSSPQLGFEIYVAMVTATKINTVKTFHYNNIARLGATGMKDLGYDPNLQ